MEPGHVMEQEGESQLIKKGGGKDVKKPFRVH